MSSVRRVIAWVLPLTISIARAASASETDAPGTVHLELPTVDVAWNAGSGFAQPSMRQSLWIATDTYQLVGLGLGKLVDPYDEVRWRAVLGRLLVVAGDSLLIGLPFGLFWQHEEWHRGVLANRRIHSFNDVYRFQPFAVTVNVSELSDRDLARLKAEHPAEFVRMSTAGIEGSYELATNLEKVQFFHRTRTWNVAAIWQAYLVNSIYQYACSSTLGDRFTDEANRQEGTDVSRRDFTGADCVAWTYDLFRQGEPYAGRGVHPSGVGVDRYRKYASATDEERRYLRTQFGLSLLNFLDPALIGVEAITTGRLRWNAHVRYMPTAFGSSLGVDGFLALGSLGLFVSAQAFSNHDRTLPGVSAEIVRYPVGRITLTGRLAAWLQPKDQGFAETRARPGGLASLRVGFPLSRVAEPYLELEGKSAGWVAGNVALEPAIALRVGLVSAPF